MAYSQFVEDIRREHPGVPSAFLDFMEQNGFGTEHDGLTYYEGLTAPADIYTVELPQWQGIALFADDGQGYCYGFDVPHGWTVVEINPLDHTVIKVADSFADFAANGPVYE